MLLKSFSGEQWYSGSLDKKNLRMSAIRRNASSLQASQRARHLDVLKRWKQTTQFSQQDDWVFASPVKLGRLPWSYPHIWRTFQNAAEDAGGGKLGTAHDETQLPIMA